MLVHILYPFPTLSRVRLTPSTTEAAIECRLVRTASYLRTWLWSCFAAWNQFTRFQYKYRLYLLSVISICQTVLSSAHSYFKFLLQHTWVDAIHLWREGRPLEFRSINHFIFYVESLLLAYTTYIRCPLLSVVGPAKVRVQKVSLQH